MPLIHFAIFPHLSKVFSRDALIVAKDRVNDTVPPVHHWRIYGTANPAMPPYGLSTRLPALKTAENFVWADRHWAIYSTYANMYLRLLNLLSPDVFSRDKMARWEELTALRRPHSWTKRRRVKGNWEGRSKGRKRVDSRDVNK